MVATYMLMLILHVLVRFHSDYIEWLCIVGSMDTEEQGCTYTGIGIGIGAYTRGIGKV